MSNAIIYRSFTGHSKKIANAIAKSLNIPIYNIKKKPILTNLDLIFIVGGIYGNDSLLDTISYVKTLDSSMTKKVVLITSSTSKKNGQAKIRKILTDNGIEVLEEEFHCYGNFLFVKIGHPNKSEIASAVEFANGVIRGKFYD